MGVVQHRAEAMKKITTTKGAPIKPKILTDWVKNRNVNGKRRQDIRNQRTSMKTRWHKALEPGDVS